MKNKKKQNIVCYKVCLICFVCVEVSQPSQPNGVMSSAVSLPYHSFTGQALSSKWLTSIVHILLPFLNQQKGENNCRNYFMINFQERMLPTQWGFNLQPPDHLSDTHPIEPMRPSSLLGTWLKKL